MNTFILAEQIKDKNDFVKFLEHFLDDFKNNPDKWENIELGNYLEAMGAFLEDSTEKSINKIDFTPSWSLFAQIMLAASVYE